MELTDDEWDELLTAPSHVYILADATVALITQIPGRPPFMRLAIEVTHNENPQLRWRSVIEVPRVLIPILARLFDAVADDLPPEEPRS
jgi:hypothetical protein